MFDPATISAAGQFLGGAGSILSGLGIGGSKSKGPSLQEQYAAAQGHERDSFNQKMSLAQQHGIHPLAMLGVPMNTFQPSIVPETTSGPDFAAIGHGAEQVSRSFVKPPDAQSDPMQDRLVAANVRLAEAQAKKAEWDALRSEFATADVAAPPLLQGQPGNPPRLRVSNDVSHMEQLVAAQSGIPLSYLTRGNPPVDIKQQVLPPHPSKLGHAAATDQAHVTVMDTRGDPVSVLNQNAVQAEYERGATITLLAKHFGLERAIEISAALENSGELGALGLGVGYLGKKAYDYLARQRRNAEARQKELKLNKSRTRLRNSRGQFVRSLKGGDR